MKTFALLRELDRSIEGRFARQMLAVDVPRVFNKRSPSNWASVWVSGEWARIQAGLSPYGVEQGLYQKPGHPNSYDLFTRLHPVDILASGYEGRWKPLTERLLETGLLRSLQVQLSDGSLASAYRSTGGHTVDRSGARDGLHRARSNVSSAGSRRMLQRARQRLPLPRLRRLQHRRCHLRPGPLPSGYENRRGLCGLVRVDMERESEGVEYRVSIVE